MQTLRELQPCHPATDSTAMECHYCGWKGVLGDLIMNPPSEILCCPGEKCGQPWVQKGSGPIPLIRKRARQQVEQQRRQGDE